MKRINVIVSNEAYAALEKLELDLALKHKGQTLSLCIDVAASALLEGQTTKEQIEGAAAVYRGESPVSE